MSKLIDLTGRTFGRLTVLRRYIPEVPDRHTKWVCKCSCPKGTVRIVAGGNLANGHTTSCGCVHSEVTRLKNSHDLTGQVFGRFTVLEKCPPSPDGVHYMCQCSCPNRTITRVDGGNLVTGNTRSCGCIGKEKLAAARQKYFTPAEQKLGHELLPNMISRCHNKNSSGYRFYGARGIEVCEEWRNDRLAFVRWALSHGYKPGLSIDRIDPRGNYEPSNCRWVDMKTQQNNRTNNHLVTIDGVTQTTAQWAEQAGIRPQRLYKRKSDEKIVDYLRQFLPGRTVSSLVKESGSGCFPAPFSTKQRNKTMSDKVEKKDTEKEETVEFMGKPCVVTKHSDGSERVCLRKPLYEEILDGFGITKEVRAKQKEVDDILAENAAKFLDQRLHAVNKGKKETADDFVKKSTLVLGGGNCCMKFDMQPVRRHSSVDPETGKARETVKYGTFRVVKSYQFATEMRKEGGLLDQIAARFEKDFGSKK